MFSSQSSRRPWIYRATLGLVAIFALFWLYCASTNWITDSEFWPITLAGHWDQWKQHPSLLYKAVFHASLSWIYFLELGSVQHLKFARFFYALLGLVFFFLFYRLCCKFLGYSRALILTLLLGMTVTGFSQIGVIRSDFLASLWALTGLVVYHSNRLASSLKLGLLILLGALMFFSTPKSVILLAAFLPLVVIQSFTKFSLRFFNWILAPLTFGASLFWLFDQALDRKLTIAMARALAHTAETHSIVASWNSKYQFVEWYLKHDSLLIGLLVIALFVQTFLGFRNHDRARIGYALFGFGLIAIFVFHEPKLPFFLGSLLPFLILSALPTLQEIPTRFYLLITGLFLVLIPILGKFPYYYDAYHAQIEVIRRLENVARAHPDLRVFDGLQLLPRSATLPLTFVGPFDPSTNAATMKFLKANPPDMLVHTARVQNLEPDFTPFMVVHYESKGPGYWVRKGYAFDQDLQDLPLSMLLFGYVSPGQSAALAENPK
ncbi:MAG: hypothetical protein ACK5Y2_10555 [Bdellovibrionales bacterium]